MKQWPLHIQLTLTMLAVVVSLALAFSALTFWSNKNYYNETTQRLYQDLAAYIVDHQYEPLVDQGVVNQKGLKQIAMHTMAINPLVEVFLIDKAGNVLGHALPEESVKLNAVDIAPVFSRLASVDDSNVVLGDNPRTPEEKRLFSVAPVEDSGVVAGYLYVVLSSGAQETIMEQVQGSHIAQLILTAVAALVALSLLIGGFLLRKLTRPLRSLSNEISSFQQSDWMDEAKQEHARSELDVLQSSFYTMRRRIISQFRRLQESSRLRRELISNVSHDLRTPLASMQGYIEAVLLKRDQLTPQEQEKYLSIAHRNSRRLTLLVSELFELSKLEAGQIKPELETFSLLELVYDVMQDYELESREQGVSVSVNAEDDPYKVVADIALMQRVLQNLIDNALRFTPAGGNVDIRLERESGMVCVTVADSGVGIHEQDLPHIFDAYYSTHNNPDSEAAKQRKQGTGLGLAIVKRILELHDSNISVQTQANRGTNFKFGLVLA